MGRVNEYGQPVGDDVDWAPGVRLEPVTLTGRTCRLEPLGEAHLDGLYDALCVDSPPEVWTYMPAGPFADRDAFRAYVDHLAALPATIPFAIVLADGRPVGIAAYLRIDHANGTRRSATSPRAGNAADHRRDRGDVPDGCARVRRCRGAPL